MTVTREFEPSSSEHVMFSLIMAIFIFYATTSLGLYFHKTLSQESFYLLSLSLVLLLWSFRVDVIDFISPALLRLFGAGGQGYLHLLSLWFVDPRDLTFVGVITRVVAGSYTAILAAIFFIPLLSTVCIYLLNLYDALTPQQSSTDAVAYDDSPGRLEQSSLKVNGEASGGRHLTRGTPGSINLSRQGQAPSVSISLEAPLVFDRPATETEELEERWLLGEFDTEALLVLCPLGKGVTSSVVLTKVDLTRAQVRRHQHRVEQFESQAGSLWVGSLGSDPQQPVSPFAAPMVAAADVPLILTDSGHAKSVALERVVSETLRQDGSFWGGEEERKNTVVIHPRPSQQQQQQQDPLLKKNESGVSIIRTSSEASHLDLHDRLLMDLVDEEKDSIEHDGRQTTPPALKYLDPQHDSKLFIPGGGPQSVILSKLSVDEGGWRKLEPPRTRAPIGPPPPPSLPHPMDANGLSRQTSKASSLATSTTANQQSLNNPPFPSSNGDKNNNRAMVPASPLLKKGMLDPQLTSKMKKNSQSLTALSELAGEMPAAGDGDNWWRPLQWLDEVQRRRSGMDEVFATAPGLAESQLSLSDLARFDSAGNADVERDSVGSGNGAAGWKRKSSFVSTVDSTDSAPGHPNNQAANTALRRPLHGSFSKSPKLVRFSNFPSAVSLTESELMHLDDSNTGEGGGAFGSFGTGDGIMMEGRVRILPCGLEELPDLVAVKIMRKTEIERMGMKKTVENERRALTMCNSPFICNIFGAFQDVRWAYILLEPVPAGDLAGLLEQRQVMFEDEARFYLGCLLLALEHLHDKGIACLDVKPENLLLDQYGYCKLCDFGIAKIFSLNDPIEQQQQQHQKRRPQWEFVGTPEYMAPEVVCRDAIAQGLPGIAGPDLWACGILLFELLSGETPFGADTNTEVVGKIQRYVTEDRAARNKTKSRYQRWTSRVKRGSLTRITGGSGAGDSVLDDDDDDVEEDVSSQTTNEDRSSHTRGGGTSNGPILEELAESPELDRVFQPICRASPAARDMIRRLLRPNPKRRLGCRDGGARVVMKLDWFQKSRFDWVALRRREMKAPFVPNPLTLAPPFRGEEVEVDITREKPLTIKELQRCQNYLKGGSEEEEKEGLESVPPSQLWKGFLPVMVREANDDASSFSYKSKEFTMAVQHVQKLFRDEMD